MSPSPNAGWSGSILPFCDVVVEFSYNSSSTSVHWNTSEDNPEQTRITASDCSQRQEPSVHGQANVAILHPISLQKVDHTTHLKSSCA